MVNKKKTYYCIELNCNNEICYDNWKYGNRRCKSCSKKGKRSYTYIDGRTLKKHYCIDCFEKGIKTKIDYTTWRYGEKKCKSCANNDKNNPNFKHGIFKEFLIKEYIQSKKSMKQIAKELKCTYIVIRQRIKLYNIPIRTKNEVNCLNIKSRRNYTGKNNPSFGKIYHGKWGIYKGINMRSSWEIIYAKWLDYVGLKWLYEPKTFDLGNTTYTPDFYLPNRNRYIEVKGYWRNKAKKKFRLFKKLYPKIRISLIIEPEILRMKRDLNLEKEVDK